MPITDEDKVWVKATCFRCSKKFDFYGEFPYGYHYDPADEYSDHVACVECAIKLGDNSMYRCLNCNGQYQSFSRWTEGCSPECCDRIDELVEKAEQRALDREQAWLESYGEDEDEMDELEALS